jgi:hypothetical protein
MQAKAGEENVQSEIEILTVRVARLERANGRLKLAGVALLLALVSLGFAGKPRTIEAEQIVIRDSHGRTRITIGTPAVSGAAIGVERDAPTIWLADEKGADRAILATDGLYFANGRARPLAELTSGPNRPELRFHDPDGKVSWSAP